MERCKRPRFGGQNPAATRLIRHRGFVLTPLTLQVKTRKPLLAVVTIVSILLLLVTRTGAAETATSKLSEQGLYQVFYISKLDPIALNQIHSWVLHVETAAGQLVADAEISVSGGMPEHNHGLPTAPQVTRYLGSGDYLVEGMKFQMGGHWVVTFSIAADSRSDSVSFELSL